MPERLIAHRMSQFIVDPLEIVHINHQKPPLVLRTQFDLPLQMCVKLPAVIQSGQPVCRDLPVLRIQINKQHCQCHKRSSRAPALRKALHHSAHKTEHACLKQIARLFLPFLGNLLRIRRRRQNKPHQIQHDTYQLCRQTAVI